MYREKKTVLPAFRRATSRLRMLPAFAVVSVERGGTTSLYRYLCQHPCVAEAFRKEVHYFDMNYGLGSGWYRAHFPLRAWAGGVRARRGVRGITGEASPYYLYHPHTPARMAELIPDVKLIALVRNPVERAYSHYHLNVRQKKENLSFEEAIDREDERAGGEREKILADESYWSHSHYTFSYLSRGHYAEHLQEWGKHFPMQRLLVLRSEDLYAGPAAVVARVFEHLELPAFVPASFDVYNQKPYPGLAPQIRRRLAEHFEPHNRRLYELLGRDLGWT